MADAESYKTSDCSEEAQERDPDCTAGSLFLTRPPDAGYGDKTGRYCGFEHTEHEADCGEPTEGRAGCC